MQPIPRPRRDDDRNAWLPFVIIAALIVLLFLAAIIVFRRDDEAGPEGSLPASFDTISTVPSTPPTTPAPTPVTTTPVVVVPTRAPSGPGSGGTDDGPTESSTVQIVGGAAEALRQYAEGAAATQTSDIVPIGSDLYAMILVAGRGQLLRWDSRTWTVADRLDPPGAIRDVDTADVTGDGVQDFLITLGGLGQPGGVYSRATFEFGLLPFNTLQGQEDFVDGLTYRLGKLQSPFRGASGSRTLTWTWTGEMFETR
jgi:hypothetical protein